MAGQIDMGAPTCSTPTVNDAVDYTALIKQLEGLNVTTTDEDTIQNTIQPLIDTGFGDLEGMVLSNDGDQLAATN